MRESRLCEKAVKAQSLFSLSILSLSLSRTVQQSIGTTSRWISVVVGWVRWWVGLWLQHPEDQ